MMDKSNPSNVRPEERRLGYYVAKADGTYDFKVSVKPANEEVLAEINSIIEVVFFLQPIAIALETALRNRLELVLFVEEHLKGLTSAGKPHLVGAVAALEGMVGATQQPSRHRCVASHDFLR